MNIPESGLIENVELAEVMAYAEKPFRDLAVAAISDFERMSLENHANRVGVTIARIYIQQPDNEHLVDLENDLYLHTDGKQGDNNNDTDLTLSLGLFSDRNKADNNQ
jgi:hypothetical protein